MKKMFILILLLFSVILCSCSGKVSEDVNNKEFGQREIVDNNKFGIINYYDYNFHGDRIYYVYDKDTNVEYIIVIYAAGYKGGISITPRYNADGTLKIHE